MDLNCPTKKLREVLRRQRRDSDCTSIDEPQIEAITSDCDNYMNEIAELYSYVEHNDFVVNQKAFDEILVEYFKTPGFYTWEKLTDRQKNGVVQLLMDKLECSIGKVRVTAARAILYILQGCWLEVQSDVEQIECTRKNTMLLYDLGVYGLVVCLFDYCLEKTDEKQDIDNEKDGYFYANSNPTNLPVETQRQMELKILLNILYIITETFRNEKSQGETEYDELVKKFVNDITYKQYGNDTLPLKLFNTITLFCNGSQPDVPIKKIMLLLWKVLLVSLGGIEEMRELKQKARAKYDLPYEEDSFEIIQRIWPSSSQRVSATSSQESLIAQVNGNFQNRKPNLCRSPRRHGEKLLKRQTSIKLFYDENGDGSEEGDGVGVGQSDELNVTPLSDDADADKEPLPEPDSSSNSSDDIYTTRYDNMLDMAAYNKPKPVPKLLPWRPKVRDVDIEMYLNNARSKFLGFILPQDKTTFYGLPEPILKGLPILQKHLYTSLSEIQIKHEEKIYRCPLTTDELDANSDAAEQLYQAMLPKLSQYVIALLKILLAAFTNKAESNPNPYILAEVVMTSLTSESSNKNIISPTCFDVDIRRHKEILIKSNSAILILLLKHFKLNHIYQFEFIAQHLIYANCTPLILKFFNQNINNFVKSINNLSHRDFPTCVLNNGGEMGNEQLNLDFIDANNGDATNNAANNTMQASNQVNTYSTRNVFSCINMLRTLNKVIKWKQSRVTMLVMLKSSPILKRTLKIRHPLLQLYALKLLKMQTKHLGRQWRKSNMKIISGIYTKVRHRLNDDWAYGEENNGESRLMSSDFQAEECALRACLDRFNARRYFNVNSRVDEVFEKYDNNLASVLSKHVEFSDEFKNNYEVWLNQEVLLNSINWNMLFNCD